MSKKTNKTHAKHELRWPEWTLIGIVACSALLIVLALCTGFFKTPQEKTEAELEKIANAYYTEYVYPRLLVDLDNDPKEALEPYSQVGVPVTYLRQLLHYNNDEYADSAKYFDMFECDTNATGVKFMPVEPYGPRDYRIIYFWQCKKGDFGKKD